MKKVIEIRDLTYTYPDGTVALKCINLDVFENQSVCLIGPNGSGKTTLLLHLNGILQSNNGSIKILDMSVDKKNLKKIRAGIGVVFQDPDDQLFSPTVFDDVAFGPVNMDLSEKEARERVGRALECVEMKGCEKRSPHHLSFGEKKRISIATVLSMNPEILVLDEPTLGLDPWIRRDYIELLRNLMKSHTVLIATHDLGLAEMCDRIYIFKEGRIEEEVEDVWGLGF